MDVVERDAAGSFEICRWVGFAVVDADGALQVFDIEIIEEYAIGACRQRFAEFLDGFNLDFHGSW